MKKTASILIVLLTLIGCSKPQAEVDIVPKPQHVEGSGERFIIPDGFKIKADNDLAETVDYLQQVLEERGIESKNKKALNITLGTKKLVGNNPETYELSIRKSGVTIKANTASGCFYGIQSLLQLIEEKDGRVTLPKVDIIDYPNFKWRSYMLDEARHFFGKEFVFKLLDELAVLKINTFHWHLTDDAGWRIEIKKYPKLTEIGAFRNDTEIETWGSGKLAGKAHGGFYTQDDIREVIEYARVRHIRVVPEIEMPGHASAAIAAYPWLGIIGELTEVPYVFGKLEDSYDISDPKVVRFLKDVLDETCKLFPSEVIHIGGDEVLFGTWSKSEEMQKYMQENNLNSPADAQIKFTNDISNYLESKGKRMMGWNEIMGKNVHNFDNTDDYKDVETSLSKKSIIHFWRGEVEMITEAAESGYEIVNSLHTDTYLDYNYKTSPLKKMYAFSPIPEGLSKQFEQNIIGVGTQMWNEWNPTGKDVEYKTFPRVAAIAEVAWSGAGDYNNFVCRLKKHSETWLEKDINVPVEEIK